MEGGEGEGTVGEKSSHGSMRAYYTLNPKPAPVLQVEAFAKKSPEVLCPELGNGSDDGNKQTLGS